MVRAYIITDGHGYWCGRRRDGTRKFDFWSTKRRDASRIHFAEAAQTIARTLPMPIRILEVPL